MASKGEIPVSWALPAAANLTASQFAAIAIDANGEAALASDPTTDFYLGTLGNKPRSGEDARVEVFGMTKGLAGEAIAIGDPITFTLSGYYRVGAITTVIDSGISTNVDTATTLVGMAVSAVASGGVFTMFQRGVHTRTQSA
jgi:hypothetical protein